MPFIRHSRDKRGFECTYVMHGYRPSQAGPQRNRVLYVFRSPSNLRIGRRPLDPEVMEALEHTHPDLAFDWSTLHRESVMARADFRAPDPYRDRPRGGRAPGRPVPPPSPPRPVPAAAPIQVEVEDHSILGVVLGVVEAARLRLRFEELLQRIARRSRTPEERDRLTDRARRLNPDDWADEAAVKASVQHVEADWDALHAELPARRRGRRGSGARGPGAIMSGDAGSTAGSYDAQRDGSTRAPNDPGDGPGFGAAATAPQPDARVPDDD